MDLELLSLEKTESNMSQNQINRRRFTKTAAGIAVATTVGLTAPNVITASRTGDEIVLGQGDHKYRVEHDFLKLPGQFSWQVTHNVAVDKAGNIFVIHEGDASKKDHPAIFVFDADGKLIRSFGKQFQGGGHGLEIREEDGEEFLYVTAYLGLKFFSKLTLKGEEVWTRRAPMKAGVYAENEDTNPDGTWGRNRFMPTNFAFLDDGGFFVADGYGSWMIHRYDKKGNYVSSFGKPGKADGEFNLPHGIWIDDRNKDVGKQVVVADRANNRLQWFTLAGKHVRTQNGFLLPANIDVHNNLMLVPELKAQITLLDQDNKVAAVLGQDISWREQVLADGMALRRNPNGWKAGKFLHPHDACFDANGNIIVAEWVSTGRVTRLNRVS